MGTWVAALPFGELATTSRFDGMGTIMIRTAYLLTAIGLALAQSATGQVLSRADEAFLKDQARRVVDSARLPAGASSGTWRNTTPYALHVPGGNMGYPAYWIRDSIMMLGGDFIPAAEIEGWIRLIVGTLLGPGDWDVRPGVVVPAYAVPDHINFNGLPTFYPGNYETGDKQGGSPWGKYPPLDDHFYFIGAVYEHWRMSGSLDLFRSKMRTSFSLEKLADLCEKIYRDRAVRSDHGAGHGGAHRDGKRQGLGLLRRRIQERKAPFPLAPQIRGRAPAGRALRSRGRAGQGRRLPPRRGADPPSPARDVSTDEPGRSRGLAPFGDRGRQSAGRLGQRLRRLHRRRGRAGGRAGRPRPGPRLPRRDDGPAGLGPPSAHRRAATTRRLADLDRQARRRIKTAATGERPTGWVIAAIAPRRSAGGRGHGPGVRRARCARICGRTGRPRPGSGSIPTPASASNPLYVATVALPYLSLRAAGLLNEPTPAKR